MIGPLQKLVESDSFERFILMVILLNAILMGLETFPELSDSYETFFLIVFSASQVIFVVEIGLRIAAHAPKVGQFFHGFWNIFDFLVVLGSLLPMIGPFALAARLLRVLRVMRIISVSDELRDFMHEMHVSLVVFFQAFVVLTVIVYIFAVSGYYLYSDIDPLHWGSLPRSLLSLIYLMLLQDVALQVEPLLRVRYASLLFFISFYLVFSIIVLNIVAAVVRQYLVSNGDPD